jgi:hypothetical protein
MKPKPPRPVIVFRAAPKKPKGLKREALLDVLLPIGWSPKKQQRIMASALWRKLHGDVNVKRNQPGRERLQRIFTELMESPETSRAICRHVLELEVRRQFRAHGLQPRITRETRRRIDHYLLLVGDLSQGGAA